MYHCHQYSSMINPKFSFEHPATMKAKLVLILLLIGVECSESSLEAVFRQVMKKALRDVPAGQSVCFFDHEMGISGDLLTIAMKITSTVTFEHFELGQSGKSANCDVSTVCAMNILLMNQKFYLVKLFKVFNFDKYSKFIVICTESLASLEIAKFMQTWGITNVLFLEQSTSSVQLFSHNLLLTEKEVRISLDANLFPNKLSNLTGYSYSIIVLYSQVKDVEYEHGQYMRLSLLDFILSRQHAAGNYRVLYEKSAQSFSAAFDVIVPYLRAYEFKLLETIEQVFLPMTTKFCLIMPKVLDPNSTLILFRPFQFQLWAFVIVGYCVLNLAKHLRTKYFPSAFGSSLEQRLDRMRILGKSFCLFILCESYSAKLTAFLNYPMETVYPKTLEEFISSPIMLQVPHPEFMIYAATMPFLAGKHALFDPSKQYNWDQVALVDKCNSLKDKFVPEPKSDMGVILSPSKYHVIEQSIFTVQYSLLFSKQSPLTRTVRETINWMFEVGISRRFIRERKREAGQRISKRKKATKHSDAFDGFLPIYRTVCKMWILSIVLFVLQWVYALVLKQVYYNGMFLYGLRIFLRSYL